MCVQSLPSHASPSPFGWSPPRGCIVSCWAAASARRTSGTAQDPARIKRLRVIDFSSIVRHSALEPAVSVAVYPLLHIRSTQVPWLRLRCCFPVPLLHSGPVSQRFVSVLCCSSAPRLGTADSCGFTGLRWVSLRPCRVVVIRCPTASHPPTGRRLTRWSCFCLGTQYSTLLGPNDQTTLPKARGEFVCVVSARKAATVSCTSHCPVFSLLWVP